MEENYKVLAEVFGSKKAKEILKLTKSYDNYVQKFKDKMNKLLEDKNLEVKLGLAFVKKTGE